MDFLNLIKDDLIEDYKSFDAVNYSLLKEIYNNNFLVVRDGIPKKRTNYLDFGSYIDKTITEGKEVNVEVYDIKLTPQSEILVNYLLNNKLFNISLEEKLKISNDLKLWGNVKDENKRKLLCADDNITKAIDLNIKRDQNINVISKDDFDTAKIVLNTLYNHEYSKDILNPPLVIKQYKQVPIKFVINKVTIKVLLDIININTKEKTIKPIDLKTGTFRNFLTNYYKYNYWLQGSLYYLAILYLKNKYKELSDYKILDFEFLYISKENPQLPLCYKMSEKTISKYVEGYYKDNNYKKGIIDMLKDYTFHKENNIFDRSREEFENNGVIELPNP